MRTFFKANVTATNGSTSVTVNSTDDDIGIIRDRSALMIGTQQIVEIERSQDTTITLADPWPFATVTDDAIAMPIRSAALADATRVLREVADQSQQVLNGAVLKDGASQTDELAAWSGSERDLKSSGRKLSDIVQRLDDITSLSSLNTAALTDGQQFSVKDGSLVRKFSWNASTEEFDELTYANTVYPLSDITELAELDTAALVDGQQFKRKEFWPGTGVGGVDLSWDASRDVSEHNGGTIIDPAKTSELDTANKTFGNYFTPDTVSGNTGCFVVSGQFDLWAFGFSPDSASDKPLLALLNSGVSTVRPQTSGTLFVENEVSADAAGDIDFGDILLDGTAVPAGTTGNERSIVRIAGTDGASTSITADVDRYQSTIPVTDSSIVAVGDFIRVESTQTFVDGWGSAGNLRGEITRVSAVSAGQVTVSPQLRFSYLSASSAKITKLNMISGIGLKNLTIKAGGDGSIHTGITIERAYRPKIKNVKVEQPEDVGIQFMQVFHGTSEDVEVNDSSSPARGSSGSAWNSGYGHTFLDASRGCVLRRGTFNRCITATTGGSTYPSINTTVQDSVHNNAISNGFTCHEPNFEWTFENITVNGTTEGVGINERGFNTTIINPRIFSPNTNGIRVAFFGANTASKSGCTIKGGLIESPGEAGVLIQPSSLDFPIKDTSIIGLEIRKAGEHGIEAVSAEGLSVEGCPLIEFNGKELGFIYGLYVFGSNDVTVTNCKMKGPSGVSNSHAIRMQADGSRESTDVTISAVTAVDCDRFLSAVNASDNIIATGNNARRCSNASPFPTATSTIIVANNLV